MTMQLKDLIRAVRTCKTPTEERAVLTKELAYIRTLIKDENSKYRERNMHKLLYVHMLGLPTHFAQMECVRLIASSNFAEKRIGYLALMLLLDEEQEVLCLATNSLQQDLSSKNPYVVGLALTALGNIGSEQMLRDLSHDIDRLLRISNQYIRKKAALCAVRLFEKCPDIIDDYVQRIISLLTDRSHSVLLTGITLMTHVLHCKPSLGRKFAKLIPALAKILRKLVTASYSPDYSIGNVTDPFLQAKILRLMCMVGSESKAPIDALNEALAHVATHTDTSKTTGYAILYECIRTVLTVECESGLRVLASNLLGRSLGRRDNNIRYVALKMLRQMVDKDLDSVQRHRGTVVDCLRDPDVSIRKRALDLVVSLVDSTNVKELVGEMLNYLIIADQQSRPDLCVKIASTARKYASSCRWEIEVLMTVFSFAGSHCTREIFSRLLFLISQTTEIDHAAVTHKMFAKLLEDIDRPELQISFANAAVWCCGEYGATLIQPPPDPSDDEIVAAGPRGEQRSAREVVNILDTLLKHHFASNDTKAMILSALLKLTVRFSESDILDDIRDLISSFDRSIDMELQQRAVEYSKIAKETVEKQKTLLARMPILQESTLLKRSGIATDDVHEAVEALDAKIEEQRMSISHENGGILPTTPAQKVPSSATASNSDDLLDLFSASPQASAATAPQQNHDPFSTMNQFSSKTNGTNASSIKQNTMNQSIQGDGGLDDLFGGNTSPQTFDNQSNQQQQTSQSMSTLPNSSQKLADDPFGDLFGDNTANMSSQTNNTSPIATTNMQQGSVISTSSSSGSPNLSTRIPSIIAYHSTTYGIKIIFDFAKPEGENSPNVNIRARISNTSNSEITGFTMLAAVPKTMKVNLKPTTEKMLAANGNNEIIQLMRASNPNRHERSLAMKLKLTYETSNGPVSEVVNVSNFPSGM